MMEGCSSNEINDEDIVYNLRNRSVSKSIPRRKMNKKNDKNSDNVLDGGKVTTPFTQPDIVAGSVTPRALLPEAGEYEIPAQALTSMGKDEVTATSTIPKKAGKHEIAATPAASTGAEYSDNVLDVGKGMTPLTQPNVGAGSVTPRALLPGAEEYEIPAQALTSMGKDEDTATPTIPKKAGKHEIAATPAASTGAGEWEIVTPRVGDTTLSSKRKLHWPPQHSAERSVKRREYDQAVQERKREEMRKKEEQELKQRMVHRKTKCEAPMPKYPEKQ